MNADDTNTMRRISSLSVFVLWLLPIGLPLVTVWVMAGANAYSTGELLLAWAIGFLLLCWLLWLAAALHRVYVTENGIRTRRLFKTRQFNYSDITQIHTCPVWAAFLVVIPLVSLTVREPDGGTRKVRFIARFTLRGWVDGVHPDVLFLQARAGLHQRDKSFLSQSFRR